MICINFVFGILIFHEPVAHIPATICSFVLLIIGLVGMSHYSSPQQNLQQHNGPSQATQGHDDVTYQSLQTTEDEEVPDDDGNGDGDEEGIIDEPSSHLQGDGNKIFLVLMNGRISLTKRQCGILGAVFNGFMTGGSLIPLHYAAEEGFGGAKFFPSYGIGAMIANTSMWLLLYLFCLLKGVFVNGKSTQEVLESMPRWYLRELFFPALSAGLMLSLAMFSTILAITYLGQGLGNSIVQSKILVSGIWGIFWYKEVVGKSVARWFASAAICMIAIIWLSYERLEAKKSHTD